MVGSELCQGVQDPAEGDPVDVADPICVVHIRQSLQLQSQRAAAGEGRVDLSEPCHRRSQQREFGECLHRRGDPYPGVNGHYVPIAQSRQRHHGDVERVQGVGIGGRAHAGGVFEPAGDMRVVDQRPTHYLQSHPFDDDGDHRRRPHCGSHPERPLSLLVIQRARFTPQFLRSRASIWCAVPGGAPGGPRYVRASRGNFLLA